MINQFCCFVLIFNSIINIIEAQVEEPWVLQKDKNGVEVHARSSLTSKFKTVRVTTTFSATITDVVNVILDADNHSKWINNCIESKILESYGDTSNIFYERYYLPWPGSDRDIVLQAVVRYEDLNNTARILSESKTNYLAEKNGLVRIPMFASSWKLVAQLDGSTKSEYIAKVNPGGFIPAWLVNAFIANGPYDSFVNLKKILERNENSVK